MEIKTATEVIGNLQRQNPSWMTGTPESWEPNLPSEPSSPSAKTPALNPGTTSDEFRRTVFGLDESHHSKVRLLGSAGEWYCGLLRRKGTSKASLAISGSSGSGKSHTARCIKKFAESWGPEIILAKHLSHWSCLWVDWVRIAESSDESKYEDLLYQINESSFIVLDDVGSETDRFKNGVCGSRLRRVLTELENKWVILTCNGTQKEIMEFYDVRVADRLRSFRWLELGDVPSYRPKLKPL